MSSHGQRFEFLLAWWNWSFCNDAESSRKLVKQTWIWTRNSSRVLNHWGVDGNFILALHLFWSWLVFYILYNLETNQSVLVLFSLPCRCCSSCWLSPTKVNTSDSRFLFFVLFFGWDHWLCGQMVIKNLFLFFLLEQKLLSCFCSLPRGSSFYVLAWGFKYISVLLSLWEDTFDGLNLMI